MDEIRAVSRWSLAGQQSDLPSDSYLGGMPLVTPDFQWPTKNGHPLGFIGQLRCADLALVPSNNGVLLFFYDNRHWGYSPKDIGHAVVVHQRTLNQLEPPELPRCEVPSFFGLRKKVVQPKVYRRVDLSLVESRSYPSLERELITFANAADEECCIEFCAMIKPEIQIGGYPSPIQSDWMELDCVNACGIGEPEDWALLLQLFAVGDMMWGDVGALYSFIHQDDLNTNRFDRVWMVSQCH